jgi:NAD-dependent dihydropyrimidine dehydrogenase PreA subunit
MPLPDDPAAPVPPSLASRARVRPARAPLPTIDAARCTGCCRCIVICPVHVLTFHTVRWTKFAALVDADPCTGCCLCEARCPFNPIMMRSAAQVHLHGA